MKTDLTYLREMSAGNTELVVEMIDIFKSQTQEIKDEMEQCFANEDWIKLGKLAHKAKASISMMGQNELAAELKRLELNTLENKDVDNYPAVIKKFYQESDIIISELEEVVNNLDKYF